MFKKLFSFFAALTLSVGLWALDNVAYIDANGQLQHRDGVTEITNSESTTLPAGWYMVSGSDVQTGSLICNGEVHLILADNAKLTATGVNAAHTPGIQVSGEGNSLTIYAQSTDTQMGQLIAIGGLAAAGIGGGYNSSGSNITINGGVIEANGGLAAAGIGGGDSGSGSNITINGGDVTANGGVMAAGIGGGKQGSGSNITINGGTVTATSNNGAGIGGGEEGDGSNITINGGKVEANGGDGGAGIGGGALGDGSNITILAGTVTATGGDQAAGIGGGASGNGTNITINGGDVTANGGVMAAGIGGGYNSSGSDIYISDAYVLKAGSAANPTDIIAHSSATDLGSTLTQQYVKMEGLATPYTREMTTGNWATVCLPYAATSFEGADFYKINYYDASNPSDLKLYIEPVDNLVAGMPYIFQTTATTVTIYHNATAPEAVTAGYEGRGLYGSFARKTIAYDAEHAYAAIANNIVNVIASENEITIPACRAYLDMDKVPTVEQPHSAPLRVMGVPRSTPTNNENVNADGNMNGKFIINGRLVIIREGKEYNALGL